ncbi:polysaccharide deacetylase family protein [Lentibacillus salicampi]|uniref:DUF3473 domain-containing protein n=1 Tax=Lentibacillus salicampi TaxID=175306 RepID=A0A4Y9ACL7_9BACI|nr:polysaccharide deacetylase family protein [Lentibacillus salicampi]TFJ93052.1 DUF3473 domain-containing protein [Lentibacillus salicampi]
MKNQKDNLKKYVSLSFDIEDWFQVESFKSLFPIETWDDQKLRVDKGTDKILNLLAKYDIKATFFILGWIADRKPELVKKIYDYGHEVSSHGYNHQLNYNMTNKELYNDFRKSKILLEDIIKDEVLGYRAPTFSISDDVIKLLGDLDYKYDSSFNQFSKHDRYGALTLKNNNIKFEASEHITEVSLPSTKFLNFEFPIAGGGFFRLYPLWLTKMLIKEHFKTNDYYVFYAHPWEFDPEMPKVKNAGAINKFRHYVNVKSNYTKLEDFINYLQSLNCSFISISDYLKLKK